MHEKISVAGACRLELTEQMPKSACCRRAMLLGMLISARISPDAEITAFYKEIEAAETAAKLLRQCFSVKSEPQPLRRGAHRFWQLQFSSRRLAEQLVQAGEKLDFYTADSACHGCTIAFLRGVFVACGTLTSPEKTYHLEFLLSDSALVPVVSAALETIGAQPKTAQRPRGVGLYFKGSGPIEELLASLGATKTVFSLINAKILREIRNHENRVANCDAGNIQKSVSATQRQLEAIEFLRANGRMDRLDDELRRTAELRAENPELSLGELGLKLSPHISKPGMYHRMNKIIQIAEAFAAEVQRKE